MLVEMNFNFTEDILYQSFGKPKKIIDYLFIVFYWMLSILLSTIFAIYLLNTNLNFVVKLFFIPYICFNFMLTGFCFNKSKTIFFPLFYLSVGIFGLPYYIYRKKHK